MKIGLPFLPFRVQMVQNRCDSFRCQVLTSDQSKYFKKNFFGKSVASITDWEKWTKNIIARSRPGTICNSNFIRRILNATCILLSKGFQMVKQVGNEETKTTMQRITFLSILFFFVPRIRSWNAFVIP